MKQVIVTLCHLLCILEIKGSLSTVCLPKKETFWKPSTHPPCSVAPRGALSSVPSANLQSQQEGPGGRQGQEITLRDRPKHGQFPNSAFFQNVRRRLSFHHALHSVSSFDSSQEQTGTTRRWPREPLPSWL